MGNFFDIAQFLEKSQGSSARTLDKAPKVIQQRLAQILGYQHDFKALHPFLKCLLAIQQRQGKINLVTEDYAKSRVLFQRQMRSLVAKPTPIKWVEDLDLPLKRQTLHARRYHPNPGKKLPLIIFYHGGGFVVGDLNTHDEACRLLAKSANVQVLSIDYPLAPEHSPEYIVGCCVEALEWIYQHDKQLDIAGKRIAVAGDSAGGNLSAVVCQKTQHAIYAPTAQLLIYPTVDFKNRYASYYKFREGVILNDNDIDTVTELYVTRHNVALDDALVSPLYGDLSKVAPAYVITSSFDLLHDEGEIYAQKLKQAGIQVQYNEITDMTHGFINFTPIHKAAKQHWINTARDFRKFWDKLK
ncbi:alpha/beta hydrolase [Acinetobacter puyangensis]|uniref:Acetyl esterase n=1 Tax=Acinetobacter puyangensis TaxID=1096779 RepID=A0A240ECJ1_9GAMM|nr:alpha/beta hydrolase [Acinetobacter puyangensis]SNX46424.1 acetyl esterase [Acinetobacter puyangensis]